MTRLMVSGVIMSGAVGGAVGAGSMVGFALSALLPALWIRQSSRQTCFASALAYYVFALHAIPVVSRNFFGPGAGMLDGIAAWGAAALVLALPCRVLWSNNVRHQLWLVPSALLVSIVPPLGLIGWASPTTAAGIFFPATGYAGFALTLMLPGCLAVFPRRTALCAGILAAGCNLLHPKPPDVPAGWLGIDTHYGGIAHEQVDLVREYQITEDIKARALGSSARVIVFPESVLPQWTAASDLFWADTFSALKSAGKVLVMGVITPTGSPASAYERLGSLAELYGGNETGRNIRHTSEIKSPAYTNGMVIRGLFTGTFTQRVPVPIGMWRPFSESGAPLRLSGGTTVSIANHTAAMLICYEQLIPWPTLTAFLNRPTIIVAAANQFWVADTAIPIAQRNTISVWARLFGVPAVFASNT